MRTGNFIKIVSVIIVLPMLFLVVAFTRQTETERAASAQIREASIDGLEEITGYKNWTKVNEKPQLMFSLTARLCVSPAPKEMREKDEKDPHKDKFITVYVNSIGQDEMLTKMNPKFPVGTVIVKEKLSSPESKNPELLTVMIKRNKGFNPEVGDWEFMTFTGDATKVTSKGKLENCQTCHIGYKENDYISRIYLSPEQRKKLK